MTLLRLLVGVLLLGALAPAVAGADPVGVITGRITDGTVDKPVVGQEVVLTVEGGMAQEIVAISDDSGRFRFEGLDTAPGVVYRPAVRFQGVDFTWAPVEFTDPTQVPDLALTVYQPTRDSASVALTNGAWVVADLDRDRQVLRLFQFLIFENTGRSAYVGPDTGGRFEVFDLASPPGALGVDAVSGLTQDAMIQSAQGFAVSQPLPPGTTQMVIGYEIAYTDSEKTLELGFPFAPRDAALLIPAGTLDAGGAVVPEGEVALANGSRVTRYRLLDAAPDGTPGVTLRGLPLAPRGLSPDRSAGRAIAVAAGLAGVMVVTVYALRGGRRRAAVSPVPWQEFAADIAELDLALAGARISPEEHAERRAELRRRAVEARLGGVIAP